MAGHSKWANIKHRKARQDAVKGRAWSKCSRAIIVAAKAGGGDPATNLTLRYAIDEAKAVNMPKDTIEKAIKKGSGELGAETYEEIRYEGYGPGGVAIIVDCLTDKVTRTAPEMRKMFEKHGGNLGKPGAVAFGFSSKGVIVVESSKISEDALMELALEAGADDVVSAGGAWEVTTEPANFLTVKEAIIAAGVEPDSAEITMIPANSVPCDEDTAAKVLRLIDVLEEHDDVQKVYHNADIADEVLEKLG
ncbi:MAG TPA: YebC/PmpR family DNA-binding transcriptional regulator [Phycisphaerales bacterium]|nr:YebC/PmpR family DNA-binding transcriptional regulator [Phycisphaerales bacterium]HRQ76803.1 YebC/PmpR family DNA-binding transcriptional regulator [Phycisphaerales bacterium]